MDWNDVLTLVIAADTMLNAKVALVGWLLWRWWSGRRKERTDG